MKSLKQVSRTHIQSLGMAARSSNPSAEGYLHVLPLQTGACVCVCVCVSTHVLVHSVEDRNEALVYVS